MSGHWVIFVSEAPENSAVSFGSNLADFERIYRMLHSQPTKLLLVHSFLEFTVIGSELGLRNQTSSMDRSATFRSYAPHDLDGLRR